MTPEQALQTVNTLLGHESVKFCRSDTFAGAQAIEVLGQVIQKLKAPGPKAPKPAAAEEVVTGTVEPEV